MASRDNRADDDFQNECAAIGLHFGAIMALILMIWNSHAVSTRCNGRLMAVVSEHDDMLLMMYIVLFNYPDG